MNMLAIKRVLAVCLLACAPWTAHSAMIVFTPSVQQVDLGQIASVDVTISGLNNQFVGAYDFFVDFDATRLSLLSADFASSLGNPFDNLTSVVESAGRVNVSEISLLPDLTGLQSGTGDLLLFTLRFQTTATGIAGLSFAENILGAAGGFLGDELGALLPVTSTPSGSITIVTANPPPPPPPPPPPNPTPEPSTLALLMAAVAAAAVPRRRRAKAV